MANELYEILGTHPAADVVEIKRAYFRSIREHPPEIDPDHFKLIRNAYETLRDAAARADYDRMQAYGGEVQRLSDEADSLLEEESWQAAARCYKRMLVLDASLPAARQGLAMCLSQLGEWRQAVEVASKLIETDPRTPAYWLGLANLYVEWAEGIDESNPQWRQLLTYAQECFVRVIQLDATTVSAFQGVAMVRRAFRDLDGAVTWLEKAVQADGKLDLEDFDSLCHLCLVFVLKDDDESVRKTVKRLLGVVPSDEDAKRYAGMRLVAIGAMLVKAHAFEPGAVLLEAASRLDPSDKKLKKGADALLTVAYAMREWEWLKDDSAIIGPIRAICLAKLAAEYDDDLSDSEIRGIIRALGTYDTQHVAASLTRLREHYKWTWKLNRESYSDMLRRAGGATSWTSGVRTQSSSSCFVVTATYGSAQAAQVDHFRRWRDRYLARTLFGRLLMVTYYRRGPGLAAFVAEHEFIRRASRLLLRVVHALLPADVKAQRWQ